MQLFEKKDLIANHGCRSVITYYFAVTDSQFPFVFFTIGACENTTTLNFVVRC